MTHGTTNFADATPMDRWAIKRRAEDLRAEEARRLLGILATRVREAFATMTGRGHVERVFVPRNTSSAIF